VAGRQAVVVQRGSITETAEFAGRVAGQDEVPLSVPVPGRVQVVNVKLGQQVAEGDQLLELDSRQVQRDLNTAKARLEAETLKLRQLQTQLQNRKAEDDRRRALDQTGAQRSLSEAEAFLARTKTDAEKLKAGASAAEREAADSAVQQAKAQVDRAQADVNRLTVPPSDADVAGAQQQVTSARLTLQKAEADLARLKQGTSSLELRTAERDVANAQSDFQRAQADLDRLQRGPDPFDVRAAEREVDRARIAIQAAESIKSDQVTAGTRDAMIANARVGLKEAEERLARQKEPAKAVDVDLAKRNVESARLALDNANERLDLAKKGPDQLALDTAQATVDGARLAVQQAETRLQAVQAGTPSEQVQAAQNALNAAQSALSIATQRQQELLSHPTENERRDADARLAAAQANYDQAKAAAQPAPTPGDTTTFDVQAIELNVTSYRAQVDTIERELASMKLRSPFQGTVVAVNVRSGDPLEPGQPAVVLSKPGEPVIRADLADRDATRVFVGQEATVLPEGKGAQAMSGSVVWVGDSGTGAGQAAQIQLAVPDNATRPAFGSSAQVTVKVGTKDNVLLVPEKAIRSAGSRRYVEYMDGSNRRIADVQVGVVSGGQAEVVSGLQEGQTVLVATS
jgi:multidrug resistance efflux pump